MTFVLADGVVNSSTLIGLLITTVFGFLGSIATMVYQSKQAERSRRWVHEDQKHEMELIRLKAEEQARVMAEQTALAAKDLAQKQIEAARQLAEKNAQLAREAEARAKMLEAKLEANTALTQKAVLASSAAEQAANNVNTKILQNQNNILAIQEKLDIATDTKTQLDRIEHVGDDTNETVKEIAPKLGSQ